MPQLCKADLCTGCASCMNACPKDAILMKQDHRGFVHPVIDPEKCIECKLCERTCPLLVRTVPTNDIEPGTYAAWHCDKTVRKESSSGGAFSALAESILSMDGVVYGAAWESCRSVRHIRVTDIRELEKLRKSKYLPSEISYTLRRVKADLNGGRRVLFSGTPCQIAGLYSYLGKTDRSNLYTVDLICHGVPSPYVFNQYLNTLEGKYGKKIVNVNFRDKRIGVECNLLTSFELEDNTEKNEYFDDNSFYRSFVGNVTLRTACTKCPFNILPRRADISLADFRGLGAMGRFDYKGSRHLGFTGLLVNNNHGRQLFDLSGNLRYDRRDFNELKSRQPLLNHPATPAPGSKVFWEEFENGAEYSVIAHKYLKMSPRMRFMNIVRIILRPRIYYLISDIVKGIKH